MSVVLFRALPSPVAGSDPPRHGARDVPRDARHPGKPPRPGGRGRQSAVARGAEEPRRPLRPRQAALPAVRHLPGQRGPRRLRQLLRLQDALGGARSSSTTFPISLLLGTMALALAVAGGLTLGILAAIYQNRGVGLRVGRPRHVRGGGAELRARRLPHHPVLVRDPALPDGRLGLAAQLGAADGDAGAGADGHHRALHARQHARGHPRRLHAHRARQGTGRAGR